MTQAQDQFNFDESGQQYTWYEAWAQIITRPRTDTFVHLLADPQANAKRGYLWMFVVGAITNTITALFVTDQLAMSPITTVLLMPLFGGTGSLISFIATNWVIQRIAVSQGAPQNYGKFHYAQALYSAPLSLITLPLMIIPMSGFFASVFQGLLLVVQAGLMGMALRAANGLTWQQAMTVVAAALFIIFTALMLFGFFLLPA